MSVQDFPSKTKTHLVFVAHVQICVILADICEAAQAESIDEARQSQVRNALFWWLKSVPGELRVFGSQKQAIASADNLQERQLYTIYLTSLTILYRTSEWGNAHQTLSLIASSLLVQLFEGFLARDELRYCHGAYTFYALSAAIPQLSAYRIRLLREEALRGIEIIELSLESMARRWSPPELALVLLRDWKESIMRNDTADARPPDRLDTDGLLLLEEFYLEACPQWKSLFGSTQGVVRELGQSDRDTASDIRGQYSPANIGQPRFEATFDMQFPGDTAQMLQDSNPGAGFPLFDDVSNGPGVVGGWLFDDLNFNFNI